MNANFLSLDLPDHMNLTIMPQSQATINIPNVHNKWGVCEVAFISLNEKLTSQGIISISGPILDGNTQETVKVTVYNLSNNEVEILGGSHLANLVIIKSIDYEDLCPSS